MKRILHAGKLSEVEIVSIEPFASSNERIQGFVRLILADHTETVLSEDELANSMTVIAESGDTTEEEPSASGAVEPMQAPEQDERKPRKATATRKAKKT